MIKQRHHLVLVLAILTGVASFFLLSGTSSAATINVTTTDTPSAVDSDCTLREAIENINDQPTQTNLDCAAGDGVNDTIVIPAGTVTLQADLPNLTKSVSIQGAGMGLTTVSGNGQWQMFQNAAGIQLDMVISRLKMTAFDGVAIIANDSNLTVSQVDIDGTNTTATYQVQGGVGFLNNTSGGVKTFLAEDVSVHDFLGSTDGNTVAGIVAATDLGGTVNATMRRVTVARIGNTATNDTQVVGIGLYTGVFGSFGSGTVNAYIENATVQELSNASNTGAGGITVASGLNTGSASSNVMVNVTNSTIGGVQNIENALFPGRYGTSLGVSTAAVQASDTVNVAVNFQNTILTNQIGVPASNCAIGSFAGLFNGGVPTVGTEDVSITSTGGNLSDDNSCTPYFTQPTDQNNLTGLAATLSALADNGGYVPTMALKQGSPAIDSGITVAGLTTDARGAARPQGSAYDSGAYESPYTKPAVVTAKPTLASSGQSLLIALGGVSVLITLGLFATKRRLAYKRV